MLNEMLSWTFVAIVSWNFVQKQKIAKQEIVDTVIAMMERLLLNVHAGDCMFSKKAPMDKPMLSVGVVKSYFAMNVTVLVGRLEVVVDFHIVMIVEMMTTIAVRVYFIKQLDDF